MNSCTRQSAFLTALVLCLAAPAETYAQGTLAPPGPPAPVMRSLDQIEPRTPIDAIPFSITNSGSYYLSTNLTGASLTAITIQSDDVSLDLKGFTLLGNGSGIGVSVNGSYTNIAIRNGILRHWTDGVYAAIATGCQLDHLVASYNLNGLLAGDGTLMTDCMALSNSAAGITLGIGCRVVNCIARMNGNNGIQASSGSSVISCVAELNGADGINLDRGLVRDCVARQNAGNGIFAFINCLVLNNTCLNNGTGVTGAGINGGNGGHHIEGNNVVGNPRGIACNPSTGNLVIRNSATGNSTNYDINVVNTAGPIVNSSNIATSTNPHANYSY